MSGYLLFFFCLHTSFLAAEEVLPEWRERMKLLNYAPRYFGPNAFPLPPLRSGLTPHQPLLELRAEYHHAVGDRTHDYLFRFLYPFGNGKAALECFFIFKEFYRMTPQTRDYRHAAELSSPISYAGDVVITASYQLLDHHPTCPDLMLNVALKTASGGRLADARFTDAAAYWLDLTAGRTLFTSPRASLRLQAMAGFYCWMTNDAVHRQNDALLYGVGFSAQLLHLHLTSDLSGFYGYLNDGDRPLHFRNSLAYNFPRNSIAFLFTFGMASRLYDSFALSFTHIF
jgi:hypothetical protein